MPPHQGFVLSDLATACTAAVFMRATVEPSAVAIYGAPLC
jgi:hypothetical protein